MSSLLEEYKEKLSSFQPVQEAKHDESIEIVQQQLEEAVAKQQEQEFVFEERQAELEAEIEQLAEEKRNLTKTVESLTAQLQERDQQDSMRVLSEELKQKEREAKETAAREKEETEERERKKDAENLQEVLRAATEEVATLRNQLKQVEEDLAEARKQVEIKEENRKELEVVSATEKKRYEERLSELQEQSELLNSRIKSMEAEQAIEAEKGEKLSREAEDREHAVLQLEKENADAKKAYAHLVQAHKKTWEELQETKRRNEMKESDTNSSVSNAKFTQLQRQWCLREKELCTQINLLSVCIMNCARIALTIIQQALEISELSEWESRLATERAQNSSLALRCENMEDELDQAKFKLRETTNKLALAMLLHKQLLLQLDMVIEAAHNANPAAEDVRRKNIELSRQILENKHTLSCLQEELECLRAERKMLKEQLLGIEEKHADEVSPWISSGIND